MDKQLISKDTIYHNLRRTSKKGLLSSNTTYFINYLALKYFGIFNEKNELIGYQCPYSGVVLKNNNDIVLEHIICVDAGGGTTLFNCIPTSSTVNSSNEKGTKHLLTWWTNSKKYWNKEAPKRLEKLVQYIFDAYEFSINLSNHIVNLGDNKYVNSYSVNGYSINGTFEMESIKFANIFDDIISYDFEESYNNLNSTQEEEIQTESVDSISYFDLINELLKELEKYVDITKYKDKLDELCKQNIFGSFDNQKIIQEKLKELILEKFNFEDRTELGFVLNVNIEELTKSLEKNNENEMIIELEKRFNNIDKILEDNNLSLYSLFNDIDALKILYKDIKDITDEDINKLINEINISAHDKFNQLIDFVNKEGRLPSRESKIEEEKQLGGYIRRIKTINNSGKTFIRALSKEQLKYLHDSTNEDLRNIYKEILYKAIENDIDIVYVDENMSKKIKEYLLKRKRIDSFEGQMKLELEYIDYIIIDNQFSQLIDFVNKEGRLPNQHSKIEKERKLASYKNRIKVIYIKDNYIRFATLTTKDQLKYLHDSTNAELRKIYKEILYKSIENEFKIEYVDENMVKKIKKYLSKRKSIGSFEEQIKLELEYIDYIIIDSLFSQLIDFVNKDGRLPSSESKIEEEQKLGNYIQRIKSVDKSKDKFVCILTKDQLKYLHDSTNAELRKIYKEILYK